MKTGFRTPSVKKSISARTTGKINRAVKKSINPLYGKNGMGYINNPKKAAYNKLYNKTTIGVNQALKSSASTPNASLRFGALDEPDTSPMTPPAKKKRPTSCYFFIVMSAVLSIEAIFVLCLKLYGCFLLSSLMALIFGVYAYCRYNAVQK